MSGRTSVFAPFHPQGNSVPKQIRTTAEALVKAASEPVQVRPEMLREALRIADEQDQGYPRLLRTSERLPKLDGTVSVVHNSPHSGNTELRRMADTTATALAFQYLATSPYNGHKFIEVRTTLDTNNVHDEIYLPPRLVGVDRTAVLVDLSPESPKEKLNQMKNPVTEAIAQDIAAGVAVVISNPQAREALYSALEVMPRMPTYSRASRLWNTAVRTALLLETGISQQDHVVDVPDSEWNRTDPMVRDAVSAGARKVRAIQDRLAKDPSSVEAMVEPKARRGFLDFLEKEFQKLADRQEGEMTTLTGAVNSMRALNPVVIKGGRSMHNYFPNALAVLEVPDPNVPFYVKMPEFSIEHPLARTLRGGIPTLEEGIEFTRKTLPGVQPVLKERMDEWFARGRPGR